MKRKDNIDRMKDLMERMAANKKTPTPLIKEEVKAEEVLEEVSEEKKSKKRVVKKED